MYHLQELFETVRNDTTECLRFGELFCEMTNFTDVYSGLIRSDAQV